MYFFFKSDASFPNFGAARIPYLMFDVNTNYSKHGLCFVDRPKWGPMGFGDLGRRDIYFQGAGEHC